MPDLAQITSTINLNFWVTQAIALGITALVLPKLKITSPIGALAMVGALALVNTTVWDAALFFSIPDSLTAQAGTTLLANGAIFWMLVKILPGIETKGILTSLLAPILFSVVSLLLSHYAKDIDWIAVSKIAVDTFSHARDALMAPSPTPTPMPR